MPYIINKYDGTELTVLDDGTINTSTSLGLIGRNYFGYGEQQNENFVFLLENFANENPPLRPIKGQTWFDTTENLLKIYDGTIWIVVGSAAVSETAPTSATIGSLWLKSSSNVLYVFNGTAWTFIGPETAEGFATTKAESSTILDSTNQRRPVILFKVNGTVVAISSSIDFTINPSEAIPGFSNLSSGTTISAFSKFQGNLEGTANRAQQLQTTRLINGVGFDGSADINITAPTTNELIPGNYISGERFNGSSPITWSVDATSSNQGNKLVVRNPNGDFSARNITANLIGNVQGNVTTTEGISYFNICYANKFEGATLTGNAETATRLRTPRQINGVLFSGVEDITVPANAQTLTGEFLNANIVSSNLRTIGTLQRLSIENEGISLGSSPQKLKISFSNSAPVVYSETGILNIGTSQVPEFRFLNSTVAQSQGGDTGFSTLIPTGNSNLGLPSRKFSKIYADQLIGKSDRSILSDSSTNLSGGTEGSIVYQTETGVTSYLPIGPIGYVLKASVDNSIEWGPANNERLNKGTNINFIDVGGNPVEFYDAQSQVTVSVDTSSSNQAGKIVSRDNNGDFSARIITASLIGNASSSTKLQTARSINGISFDGTADINLPLAVKAWVVFEGSTGTIVNAFNINSVVIQSSGKYRINIASGIFSNGNFAASGMSSDEDHFIAYRSSTATTLDINTIDNSSGNNTTQTTSGRVMVIISG
jgi:hypothetical protein